MRSPLMLGLLVILSISSAARAADEKEAITRPPNIILILADDLGWGDLACYGNKRIHTPNLDRMAAEGMRFTQSYAGSSVCSPSRAVLLTGLHTGHAYQRANDGKNMRAQDVTIAEVLKTQGYATGLIGKWGLAARGSEGVPTKQGFDVFYGYLGNMHAHNYYPPFLYRGEQREMLANIVPNSKDGRGRATKKENYSNDLFLDESLTFIEQRKGNPFFLYLAFTLPHANNEAGKETGNGMEVPDLGGYAGKTDWPEPRKGHAAMVSRLDRYVGQVLEHVKKLGIENDTLVLFTSDNGPHAEGGYDPEMNDSNGPLRGHKRDLYEGGIRVPLIARWPGRVPAGARSDELVWFADLLPTLADLAGVTPANIPPLDGLSLRPTLLGEAGAQKKHDYLYWEFYEQGGKQAVRAGNWKAVRRPLRTGKTELYDLRDDLSETRDVAAENPEIVKKLEAMMDNAHTPSDDQVKGNANTPRPK